MRKPESITYWLEARPPWTLAWMVAVQQLSFLGVYLVLSPLLISSLNLGPDHFQSLMSSTLMTAGLGVILQAYGGRWTGSGYFCPLQVTSASFAAMSLAASYGGMGLVFGMMSVVGLTQLACSFLFRHFRGIFSVEVAGLSILLMGLGMGGNGLRMITNAHNAMVDDNYDMLLAATTLTLMIACNVWIKGRLRLFSAFAGMLGGTVCSYAIRGDWSVDMASLTAVPSFRMPVVWNHTFVFNPELIPSFVITGLVLALHGFGALVLAQRFNDADWKRPDMHPISSGIRAEAITNLLCSLSQGLPLTSSGGAVTLGAATGCTSRIIALWLGGMFILMSFIPRVFVLWRLVPEPVIGASMLFLALFTSLAGLQMIASRLLDNRKIIAVGIGLITGISYETMTEFYRLLPPVLQLFTLSGVATGVTTAILLSALFRIGSQTRKHHEFDLKFSERDEILDYLERQGSAWGARPEVVTRAENATWQAIEILIDHSLSKNDQIEIETIYDEFSFSVILHYAGGALDLPTSPPSHEEFLNDEGAVLTMAGYLLRRLADHVRSREVSEDHAELQLTFRD